MDTSLTGKVALVTGGSPGLGAATARALADIALSYVAKARPCGWASPPRRA